MALLAAAGCSSLVATMVARAPNHGLAITAAEDAPAADLVRKGINCQLRVDVGPPAASLSVWVVEPPRHLGLARLPRGTIVLLHGWHRGKSGLLRFARPLARAGYRAVLVDHRGQGNSSGDWLTYGVVEARDLSQVLDGLEERGLLAGPVGVLGYSYGAAVAIQFAAGDERVKAVVALAPFSSLRDVVPRYVRLCLPLWGWLASGATVQDAISAAGLLAGFDPSAASPLAAIGRRCVPVLLVHGRSDWLIPAAHSQRLHAAAPGGSDLLLINGGHNALCRDPGGLVSAAGVKWFERWLAAADTRPLPPG